MKITLATDIINQRIELDTQGKIDTPVFVNGFPRVKDQEKLFIGKGGITSVSLEITPETAVYRTIRRISEAILADRPDRGDDLFDLSYTTNDSDIKPSEGDIREIIIDFISSNQITSALQLSYEMLETICKRFRLAKDARYRSYERVKPGINESLLQMSVETMPIARDELTMGEVS